MSPGANALKPPLPGVGSSQVFTLKDLPDTDSIKSYLEFKEIQSVVIVGGGYIGLEAVENFSRLDIDVTIIEKSSQLMPPLDYEMAALLHRHLRDQEIKIYLEDGVKSFHEKDGHIVVNTEKGLCVTADLALLVIGVKPEKALAEQAGLNIGSHGGIAVDEKLRTSDPDIYAIGDAIEVTDLVSGRKRLLALAGPANKQGRVAADNIMGKKSIFDCVLDTTIVRVFDIQAASTGNKEAFLKQTGRPYLTSYTHSYQHATYYPGAKPMAVKLLFDPHGGKILGAQIVGETGVDKRIDVLATAIRAGMTVCDLGKLDLAYAPQFGSAKDAVNVAGLVAANILEKEVKVVHWNELSGLNMEKNVLLDVRTSDEVKQTGTIMNAVHIHVDELRDRLYTLDRSKT